MILITCSLIVLINFVSAARLFNCPTDSIKFEKILGLRPFDNAAPLLLYHDENENPITTKCIEECQKNSDCRSFVVLYNTSSCFWYKSNVEEGVSDLENILDNNADWFLKSCFIASTCAKQWIVERIPGAILIGNDTKVIPNMITRNDCIEHCLNETEFQCRSAKYKVKDTNYGPDSEVLGRCSLSSADRHLLPNAYRVSSYDDEYFENQCSPNSNRGNLNEFCTYEEYENVNLAHTDLSINNRTKQDCEDLCENSTTFNCRGYSLLPNSPSNIRYKCLLHSEDSKVFGPKLLKNTEGGKYYEKATCLNVTVTCSESLLKVTYSPNVNFMGRIYMQGYAEHPECFAQGHGQSPVILNLSLLTSQCGVSKADAPGNRTLLSGAMILQYYNFIQTQADRIIRVGCIFGNESKFLVATNVNITSQSNHKGSDLVNTSSSGGSDAPKVQMRIVDLNTHEEASETQIGQELQLVIELIKPFNGPYDIFASHLIAMTDKNEESIFLLDDRGCPVNLNVFPPLKKIYNNDTRVLYANFQAFKFATSPVVRFTVMVQFCPNSCPSVDCSNNIQSYGKRRKRSITTSPIQIINDTKITNVSRSQFENNYFLTTRQEVPLNYVMYVRDPKISADRLSYSDHNKILVAGYDFSTNEVCLDYSLFIGLIITWLLIQIIFVVSCILLVRRYKRFYEHERTRQSLEELHKNFGIGFSNLENRRVHWADNSDFN